VRRYVRCTLALELRSQLVPEVVQAESGCLTAGSLPNRLTELANFLGNDYLIDVHISFHFDVLDVHGFEKVFSLFLDVVNDDVVHNLVER